MNKSLFIIHILLMSFLACVNGNEVSGQSRVFDRENIFTDEEEKELNEIIDDFERETTNEIIVVTTDNIGDHEKMVSYAVEFGNSYGVGKAGKDNGLVIVFSKTLRENFIATGLSTEKILTDEVCQQIVDSLMVPEFKRENYFTGIKNGLEGCIRLWRGKE